MTGMEACKVISKYWLETTGEYRSPIDIWHYSPFGELFMVFKWYDEAEMYFKVKEELNTNDLSEIMKEVNVRLKKKYDEQVKEFKDFYEEYKVENEL